MTSRATSAHRDEPLHDLDWLAGYLGISKKTVYSWRLRGVAPPAYRIGRHLRWSRADVDAWLAERR
jgi:excisionase family DNA binding protein